MAKKRRVDIQEKAETDRLPEWSSEGAILAEWLEKEGVLEEIGERLRVQREGGYVGLDVLLFFLFFFASGLSIGIKEFGRRTKSYRRELGALGGRIQLPTPPSVSRFLGSVEEADSRKIGSWLLVQGAGAREILQHPSTSYRDTLGDAWHFFDWDPTSTVLRQRGLPVMDELPEGKRRAKEFKKGYPGRKRGEVQLSRATLQHAGSGLWLGLWMGAGNGNPRAAFEAAVQTVRTTCEYAHLAAENAVLRSDGQGGNIPCITACQTAGIRYVTRWIKYPLLDQNVVREQLNKSDWYEVPDSGSGPRREATELGWMMLQGNKNTRKSDGSRYKPVKSRLVVSRFRTDKRKGTGVVIDGWQYELFATDLPESRWPAAELVMMYYGRCGQENRFYQEDRELGLDRIFSYHLPGQELVNLIGLFVWNLRICRGMELLAPPTELLSQTARMAKAIVEPVQLEISTVRSTSQENHDPSRNSELAHVRAARDERTDEPPRATTTENADPAVRSIRQEGGEPVTTVNPSLHCIDDNVNTDTEANANDDTDRGLQDRSVAAVKTELSHQLNDLDWPALLRRRPDWNWDPEHGMVCPDGVVIPLVGVKRFPLDNKRHLRFKAPYATCPSCERRSGCTASTSPIFCKEVCISLPAGQAALIGTLLAQSRPASASRKTWRDQEIGPWPELRKDRPKVKTKTLTVPPRRHQPKRVPIACTLNDANHHTAIEGMLKTWQRPAPNEDVGTLSITAPILLPATLRNTFRDHCRVVETHVVLDMPPRVHALPIFALTPAQRQHRRLSWTQRHAWNQLPNEASVSIRFAGAFKLRSLLRRTEVHRAAA